MCNRNTARPPPFHPVTGTTMSSLLRVHTHDRLQVLGLLVSTFDNSPGFAQCPNPPIPEHCEFHPRLGLVRERSIALLPLSRGFSQEATGRKQMGRGPAGMQVSCYRDSRRTLRHACLRKLGSQAELDGDIQITTGRTQAGSPTWPLTREMGSGHKPGAGSLETQKRPLRDHWGAGF